MNIKFMSNIEDFDVSSIQFINDKILNVQQQELFALEVHNDNKEFFSQLIIVVENEFGVLLRFCDALAEDEFVAISKANLSKEVVETFDGGDVWEVPKHHFLEHDEAIKIIMFYLNNGSKDMSFEWGILGLDL